MDEESQIVVSLDCSGFKPAKHMVFAGVYPADGSDFDALNHAIERLTCNDASVSVSKESSGALGMGFRYELAHFRNSPFVIPYHHKMAFHVHAITSSLVVYKLLASLFSPF